MMSGCPQPIPPLESVMPPNLQVLIVEDVPEDAELIILTLEAIDGAMTFEVTDTLDKFEQLLQRRSWDVVLSDYRLKGFTGYQVLNSLRQSGQEIPLILVTGSLGEEAAVDCIKAGMTDYVLKDRLFRLPMALERSLREFELNRQQQAAMVKIRQQAKQEQLLNQISRTINSSLDPNYILQEIVRLTGESFNVDRVLIFKVEVGQIRITHEWRVSAHITSMLDYMAPVSEWPALIDLSTQIFSHEVFHVPDYTQLAPTPARSVLLRQKQTRSLLSAPIWIQDEFFGGIDLYTTQSLRTFTEDEIHFLKRISDQAAIALYNAQSYERLEQLVRIRTRELEEEKFLSDAANRAKSEFLANMSHELRTPLTGILGFSSVLLKQIFGPLTDKQLQYIENIASCGQHLLSLINDLLDLTKIEAGREELILEAIDLQEFCEACVALLRERAEEQGLQISLKISPDLKTVTADRRRLKQILFNLLSNAVKFTQEGSVSLRVEKSLRVKKILGAETEESKGQKAEVQTNSSSAPLSSILFHVCDTGIGISQADLDRLFQPFQQLDSGLDRKYEGTGLGLVLARKLAQLHGGDVTVASEVGSGSCFTVQLPG